MKLTLVSGTPESAIDINDVACQEFLNRVDVSIKNAIIELASSNYIYGIKESEENEFEVFYKAK